MADGGDPAMNRRSFDCLVASGLMTVRFAAIAQQSAQVYRIGYLRQGKLPIDDGFFDAMRILGWIEGQNFTMISRYADNLDQLPMFATELVQLKVDLMITDGTPATLAAKHATTTIPIVFNLALDPVQSGIVVSLATPGGNITGFAWGLRGDKLLEILQVALPRLSRVAVATPPSGSVFARIANLHLESPAISHAAKLLGVQVLYIEMRDPESPGTFFASAWKAGADAALIPNVASFGPHLGRIAGEATTSRMPSIGSDSVFAKAGGLLSYGAISAQNWPRMAAQIDKIFNGAKPGDLPVEQPTRFEFVINLKTAKTLGLAIPQSLLLRASEVIQ
jgi:putative ABC transport system substrate-binding protein